jgi:hypothetical protein
VKLRVLSSLPLFFPACQLADSQKTGIDHVRKPLVLHAA